MSFLVDQFGNKVPETAKPPTRSLATVAVRDKWGLYPANGLTPQRLAHILREADQGDMLQQAELFSQLEERDGHLASIFGTRKLAISGLEWKFEPFSDDAKDKEIAEAFAAMWEELDTDELLLDLMDAVSKGVSFTALNWAAKDGGFVVDGSESIDQKHWRFDLDDKRFRLMTDEQPLGLLPTFGQVVEHRYRARSGSPTRAGVMRTCVWAATFKNYAIKDWVTFSEVYGMPVRIGKYDPSTSKEEREALELAVAMIGSDAAGVISRDTEIELLEAAKASSVDVYKLLIEFCEATQSKAVLGQTLTSSEGRHGTQALGNVHEEVRQDLLKADARAVSKTLRMQLIRPWIVFNRGAQYADRAPKPVPQISDPEDLEATSRVVETLVGAGLPVPQSWAREKFAIPEPKGDEPLLGAPKQRLDDEGKPKDEAEDKPKAEKLAALAATAPLPGRASLLTGTLFADALAESAREGVAGETLAKVQAVVETVRAGAGLNEAKAALAGVYATLPRAEALRLLEAVLTLGELAGRYSVNEGDK